MTVYAIGLVRSPARSKILGKTVWGSVTHKRSVQLLVGLDDETNTYVLVPYDTQFPPDDLLQLDYEALETLDVGMFREVPRSVQKHRKCSKQILRVEDSWKEKGATLEPVSKPDSSFLLGKRPKKMGRKQNSSKKALN